METDKIHWQKSKIQVEKDNKSPWVTQRGALSPKGLGLYKKKMKMGLTSYSTGLSLPKPKGCPRNSRLRLAVSTEPSRLAFLNF